MANRVHPPFHPAAGDVPMVMGASDFRRAFPGEGIYVEWKSGLSNKELQRAVVAFSNTDGGVVILGVDDAGNVVGKPKTPGVEDQITEAILEVNDPGRWWLHELLVEHQRVTILSVARREQGFAQTPRGEVLVRKAARCVPLIGPELRAFMLGRSLQSFDASSAVVPVNAADPAHLRAAAAAWGWAEVRAEFLQSAGLAVEGGADPVLTGAGLMILTGDPSDRLPKAYIEILRFGDDSSEYDRREEIRGPAQHQVEAATRFLADELGSDVVVSGLRRHDLPRLPEVVLREVVANAVAHRSYEGSARAIEVRMYPDRVVVTSPGGLVEPVTEENLREVHAARNPAILRALRRFGLAEDIGRGIDVIEDQMAISLMDPPRFSDLGHSFEVVLPIRGGITPAERAWILDVQGRGEIEPSDRILLVHAARGSILTNASARELLSVDSREARAALGRLRDLGFLEQSGTRGGTSYVLTAGLGAPPAFRMDPAELRHLVLELVDERGEVSNADVRRKTGLDRAETLRLLSSLVEVGELERRGNKRGTRYRRSADLLA